MRKTVVISSVVKDGASVTDICSAATLDFIRQFTTSQDKHVAMIPPRLESHFFTSADQNCRFVLLDDNPVTLNGRLNCFILRAAGLSLSGTATLLT